MESQNGSSSTDVMTRTARCDLCGAALIVPNGERPRTVEAGMRGMPTVHVILAGTIELHRCMV
jgi:hypothetical protein